MKKKMVAWAFAALLLLAGESLASTTTEASAYHKISAAEAKAMMETADALAKGEGLPYILVDVRTEEEYMEQRIDCAVLLPDFEIRERAEAELPDHDALIFIYCRSGRRSALAAQMLADMGYLNIYDFGGIIDWPFDTVSGSVE